MILKVVAETIFLFLAVVFLCGWIENLMENINRPTNTYHAWLIAIFVSVWYLIYNL